jgi:hypothetical protein
MTTPRADAGLTACAEATDRPMVYDARYSYSMRGNKIPLIMLPAAWVDQIVERDLHEIVADQQTTAAPMERNSSFHDRVHE